MKYDPIELQGKEEIEAAISRDNADELLQAVLSAALYSEDGPWAEEICVRLSGHKHFNVRGNAILGLGHIARIHRKLNEVKVKPLIQAGLSDESDYVRKQADAAADDVELFLKWKLDRSG